MGMYFVHAGIFLARNTKNGNTGRRVAYYFYTHLEDCDE
jgi:hypothetical protein